MNPFTLAVAQLRAEPLNKDANLGRIEAAMREAAARGAGAILFSELFLTGYLLTDALAGLAEPVDGPGIARLSRLARTFGLLTVCGFPEAAGPNRYNSAVLIERDGTILGTYRKTHLFGREPEYFTPGDRVEAVTTSLGRLGVLICYDIEFPETVRLLAVDGARLVLTATANMTPYEPYQAVYTRARAMENGIYFAIANTTRDLGPFHFFGESAIVDPDGEPIDRAGSEERILYAPIDLERVPEDPEVRYLGHRRPELYQRLAAVASPLNTG
ncbi:MAG TPA: nitrilase-related carbon-nitrogen hydrolase [Candidatus Limnocylindrales bacterium]|nr:nitrilase-related carbon-nitrogen hydrolase [Candidatus Limnocylindrales bacterium]